MCRLWSSPVFCGLPFHPRYEVAKARYSQRSQYPVVCDLGCKKRRRRFHRYMQNMITKHVEGLIHMNKIITVYNHIYIYSIYMQTNIQLVSLISNQKVGLPTLTFDMISCLEVV